MSSTMRAALAAGVLGVGGLIAAPVAAIPPGDPPVPIPGPAAVDALAALEQPSAPVPFPGDAALTPDRFVHPGTCAELRGTFQSPGAPVPLGSTFTEGRFGSLMVAAPYGTSAIFTEDDVATSTCVYSIRRQSTVTITVPGLATVFAWVPVACLPALAGWLIAAEFDPGDGPRTVVALQLDPTQPWSVYVVQGAFEATLAQGLESAPPGAIVATGPATFARGVFTFEGATDAGPMAVGLSCTPFPLSL
jgi:hypothetical protein